MTRILLAATFACFAGFAMAQPSKHTTEEAKAVEWRLVFYSRAGYKVASNIGFFPDAMTENACFAAGKTAPPLMEETDSDNPEWSAVCINIRTGATFAAN